MFADTSQTKSSYCPKAVFLLIVATIFLLSVQYDIAYAEKWENFPIYGGEMLSLAISPDDKDLVYVGTRDAGVFKTTNGGQSWQPARKGLTFMPIREIEIDPQNPNVLYAGSDFDGIWKSSNGGISWTQMRHGVLDGYYWVIEDIVIDYQNTQIIYVAYHQPRYGGRILKSVNGGVSWTYKDNGIKKDENGHTDDLYSLEIDPNDHLKLYVGTRGDGAFRTTDGGESWQAINCGIPAGWSFEYGYVYSFAFDPHSSDRLCSVFNGVETEYPETNYYFFNTDNCWERISTDQGHGVQNNIIFHPTDEDIMYSYDGSLSISYDGGITWGYSKENIQMINDLAFHSDFPDTVYAATDWYGSGTDDPRLGGVYKTADGATTWSEMNQGITARVISSAAIDPEDSDNIYVLDDSDYATRLYRSQDRGQIWQKEYAFRYDQSAENITVDPLMSNRIYTWGWTSNLLISTDYGQTFNTIEAVDSSTSIAFDPELTSTIYVGSIEEGVYKSIDSGLTWSQKRNGLPIDPYLGETWIDSVAVDPNNSSVVWAGNNAREGIFKSEDGGESWLLKGLKDDADAYKILSIAINPDNSNNILVGTGICPCNIWKTTNGGVSWAKKLSNIGDVNKIIHDPRDSNIIYAATEGSGIIRSTDVGETWHSYSNGIFYPVVYSLEVTNENPPLLVTGSYGSGLYYFREKITVTPLSGLKTTEEGDAANFTVVLNDQPTSNVTICISSSNMNEGIVSPGSLVFNIANWDNPQTVTITGVDDSMDDGDIAYTITTEPAVSVDMEYNGRDADDVRITNIDNDDQLCFPVKAKSGKVAIICM